MSPVTAPPTSRGQTVTRRTGGSRGGGYASEAHPAGETPHLRNRPRSRDSTHRRCASPPPEPCTSGRRWRARIPDRRAPRNPRSECSGEGGRDFAYHLAEPTSMRWPDADETAITVQSDGGCRYAWVSGPNPGWSTSRTSARWGRDVPVRHRPSTESKFPGRLPRCAEPSVFVALMPSRAMTPAERVLGCQDRRVLRQAGWHRPPRYSRHCRTVRRGETSAAQASRRSCAFRSSHPITVPASCIATHSHQATLATARDKSGGALVDTVVHPRQGRRVGLPAASRL